MTDPIPKSRADRCTTHHYACDCREYQAQQVLKIAMGALEFYSNPESIDLCQQGLIPQLQFTKAARDAIAEINAMYGEKK